ncbi:MAG: NTP transferase domain-containing protein [Patescibacteria group bacterium]|nr:NTP transferase domain-containing protein [Patescibacteria group bacterium]
MSIATAPRPPNVFAIGKNIGYGVKKAVLPCAGYSERLRRLSPTGTTKLLLPLHGHPLIGYILNELRALGISDIACVVSSEDRILPQVVGDGSQFGVRCRFLVQPEHNGPGGALLAAADWVDDEAFVVALPDTIHLVPSAMVSRRKESFLAAACASVAREDADVACCCRILCPGGFELADVRIAPAARWVLRPSFFEALGRTDGDAGGEIRIPSAAHNAQQAGLRVHYQPIHPYIQSVNINTPRDYHRVVALLERGYVPTLL